MSLILLVMSPVEVSLGAGSWTPLANTAPGNVELMLLLPDGTVMCANGGGNAWYRLTPDIHGSYVNGTWTTLASMRDTRLYFSSAVLSDGRVFVAGGEYGSGAATAEVYSPQGNFWTPVSPPVSLLDPSQQAFYDSPCKILSNGTVLVSPVIPSSYGGTLIYDPVANSWAAGPTLVRGFYQDEASWVILPDNSILTVDPFGSNSERYIPVLNRWIDDSVVPTSLYSSIDELGAAFLLADGRAFFLGGSGHTAFYAPSGNLSPGIWTVGPDLPSGLGISDGPAAMMVNGNVLCAVGSASTFNPPTQILEFDPVANSFSAVSAPSLVTAIPPYEAAMLDLPDGSVLVSCWSRQVYAYRPSGAPLSSGKPTIASIVANPDGTFHLTGTLLNGISEGAAYGDDLQMDSNYPLVRLSDAAGNIRYARTFNWSSTGVMTGSLPVTTEFAVPSDLPFATYSLVVVANGNSSDPISFVPAPSPTLQCVRQPDGTIKLTWTSVAGLNYQVQFNPNAGQASWSNLGSSTTATGATSVVSDTVNADRRRFYRVLLLP